MYINKKLDGTSNPNEFNLENFEFKKIKKNKQNVKIKIDFLLLKLSFNFS